MKLRIPRRIKMESSEEEYSEDSEQSANLQNNIINSEDNNKGSMVSVIYDLLCEKLFIFT